MFIKKIFISLLAVMAYGAFALNAAARAAAAGHITPPRRGPTIPLPGPTHITHAIATAVNPFAAGTGLASGPITRSISLTSQAPVRPTKIVRFDDGPLFGVTGPSKKIHPIGCLYPTTAVFAIWEGWEKGESRFNISPLIQRDGLCETTAADGKKIMSYAPRSFGIFSSKKSAGLDEFAALNAIPVNMIRAGDITPALGDSTGTPEKEHRPKATNRTGKTIAEAEAENILKASQLAFKECFSKSSLEDGSAVHFIGPYICITCTQNFPTIVIKESKPPIDSSAIVQSHRPFEYKSLVLRNEDQPIFIFMASPSFWLEALDAIEELETLEQLYEMTKNAIKFGLSIYKGFSTSEDYFKNVLQHVYSKMFGARQLRTPIHLSFIRIMPKITPPKTKPTAPLFAPTVEKGCCGGCGCWPW